MSNQIVQLIRKHHAIVSPTPYPNFDQELDDFLAYVRIKKQFAEQKARLDPFQAVGEIASYLGIEVEVENIHRPIPMPAFWKVKSDGSLRNGGHEFVSSPLAPTQSMTAFLALWIALQKLIPSHSPDFNWRTGIHVHLNVQQLSEVEFRRLLLLCVIFEPILFSFAGEERKQNMFCVPITESTTFSELRHYLSGYRELYQLATTWPKYNAINLCRMFSYMAGTMSALPALGTLEFRHFGGSADIDQLFRWQSVILRLYDASIKFSTAKLKAYIEGTKYTELMRDILLTDADASVLIPAITRAKELTIDVPPFKPMKSTSALAIYTAGLAKKWQKQKQEKEKARYTTVNMEFTIPPLQRSR
jgi:hypothetical protein